jgi:peptidoglycan/LPS O-acetylase OafA/YrhL
MKLVLFFAFMLFSLVLSLLIGRYSLKNSTNLWKPFMYSVLTNIGILGFASAWWFLTETDGISQGLGVIYYCIAMALISLVNLVVLSIFRSKQGS